MLTSPQRRLLREADIDKRKLERQAASGDEEAQSKELVMKMRNGELTQEQVKLLSYLSYKPAISIMPTNPSSDLIRFVDGLEPWGREALVKAAIISARSVLHVWEDEHPDDSRPREAIESANSRNSTDASSAASDAWVAASDASSANAPYAVWAAMAAGSAAAVYATAYTASGASWAADAAHIASKVDPGLNVRGIIEKELIDWVLKAEI